ncbi:hypothetical protein HUF15_39090 [Streptomyces samsunensis]|nr:hypothetical protein [Streptomyces samsunensis]
MTITGDGVWQGRRLTWPTTYGNSCELRARAADGMVFEFSRNPRIGFPRTPDHRPSW